MKRKLQDYIIYNMEKHKPSIKNSIGMEFVLIESGNFIREDGCEVSITKPFHMCKYQTTQKDWIEIMGENPSGFEGNNNPVEKVLWKEVQEFIKKLNAKEGANVYKLPTEAEWEYCCRAGSKTKYCFGDDENLLKEYAWYNENSEGETHPVGLLKPNKWGLYDMHGNVWEWCEDFYDDYSEDDVVDYVGPHRGSDRVIRGGNFTFNSLDCRSSLRGGFLPDSRGYNCGFRLVKIIH